MSAKDFSNRPQWVKRFYARWRHHYVLIRMDREREAEWRRFFDEADAERGGLLFAEPSNPEEHRKFVDSLPPYQKPERPVRNEPAADLTFEDVWPLELSGKVKRDRKREPSGKIPE